LPLKRNIYSSMCSMYWPRSWAKGTKASMMLSLLFLSKVYAKVKIFFLLSRFHHTIYIYIWVCVCLYHGCPYLSVRCHNYILSINKVPCTIWNNSFFFLFKICSGRGRRGSRCGETLDMLLILCHDRANCIWTQTCNKI